MVLSRSRACIATLTQLCLLCIVIPLQAGAGGLDSEQISQTPSAQDLLSRLAKAVRYGNYAGRLTYEHSGKLEVMEIAHAVFDGVEYERVSYLNGPRRGVVKSGRKSDCATLGSHLFAGGKISVEQGHIALASAYQAKVIGVERVADRLSWIIRIQPKDELRHGLVLAVDQENFLPTKTLFVSATGKVLERLHYVSLDQNSEFTKPYFVDAGSYTSLEDNCPENKAPQSKSIWRPSWIPAGFVLSHYTYSDEDGHMETYTDGLASFSIFSKAAVDVKLKNNASKVSNEGAVLASTGAKKGATLVLMKTLMKASTPTQIAVIGEIPKDTANRILTSVEASSLRAK